MEVLKLISVVFLFCILSSFSNLSSLPGEWLLYDTASKKMEQLPGKHKGSNIFLYNDYIYSSDSRNKKILRCNTRRTTGCPGAIIIKNNDNLHILRDHNHAKSQFKLEHNIMREKMLKLCRETVLPPKEIFDTVCRNYPEAAIGLTYATLKATLFREKCKLRPKIPNDMHTLSTELNGYMPLQGFYKGYVVSDDGKIALIFTSNELLKSLTNADAIYTDGTFKIVPRFPPISQLYTIHIRLNNVGICTIFVLSESRNAAMYRVIWKRINELVPTLQKNIKYVMSDYEIAAMKVLSEQFPMASTHGCWFHYNEALLRRWRKLGLSDAPRNILTMAMNMALAPASCFEDAINLITLEANTIKKEYPTVTDFLIYLNNVWLPLASKVSVFHCPVRTNNTTESFHNLLGKKFGNSHNNIWVFLDNLRKLINDEEIKLKRLQTSEKLVCRVSNKNRKNDEKILNAQKNFANGRICLHNFLCMFKKEHEDHIIQNKLFFNGSENIAMKNFDNNNIAMTFETIADVAIDIESSENIEENTVIEDNIQVNNFNDASSKNLLNKEVHPLCITDENKCYTNTLSRKLIRRKVLGRLNRNTQFVRKSEISKEASADEKENMSEIKEEKLHEKNNNLVQSLPELRVILQRKL